MKNYGYIPSLISTKTVRYTAPKSMALPMKYTYVPFLPPVTNQGDDPYCIPHSIATWLNWKENVKTGAKVDNHVAYKDIYNSKKSIGEGMTYQEAFNYLKKKGVKTDKGIKKITEAGIVASLDMLKQALIANGPCFGALPIYDPNADMFWKKTKTVPDGWHSVTIVGWDEKGYIIRNSWGTSFGNRGYVTLPYEDIKKFREIWTILG